MSQKIRELHIDRNAVLDTEIGILQACPESFTPLESPGIYAGDVINRKHQLLVKVGLKPHLSNGIYS